MSEQGPLDANDPRSLRRNDHPETSGEAAESLDQAAGEEIVLNFHIRAGMRGCVLDDMRKWWAELKHVAGYSVASRRSTLHRKGQVTRIPETRRGVSGRSQGVYIASELLRALGSGDYWFNWLKENHPELNPFLFDDDLLMPYYDSSVEVEEQIDMKVRSYLIYAGNPGVQPKGFMGNLIGSTRNKRDARTAVASLDGHAYHWWAIVKKSTMQVIEASWLNKPDA